MTFAPNLNTGVDFNRPVESPSPLGTVASLVDGFLSTNKPVSQSQASIEASDKALFYENLQKGRALMEQGKAREGERVIRSAYRGYTKRYGMDDEGINSAFQDATGISSNVEVTGSAIDIEELSSTPEFNVTAAYLQSQNPDASPDEIFGQALNTEVQRRHTDLAIERIEAQEKVNWYDVESVYVDKARQAGDTIRGILASAQKDQIITPDEARELRSFYDSTFGSTTKPVGVNQESWDRYQEEYLDPLSQIVDGAIGLGQQVGIDTDMSRALQQIVSKAVAQGKLPASILVRMQGDSTGSYDSFIELLKQASKDPEATENYNFVMNASFDELLSWVTEFEYQTDMDDLKIDTTEFEGLDPEKKRESLVRGSAYSSASAEMVAPSLIETNAKVRSIQTQALQPGDFSKIFNKSYFSSIEKVFKANPVIGRQIAQDAVEAIDSQRVAISRALTSEAEQLGFKVVGGEIVPDEKLISPVVKAWVDKYFGGDWNKAYEARGKAPDGIHTNANIVSIVNTVEKDSKPKLRKFIGASQAVEQLKEQFLTPEVTGLGDEELGGSQGEDTLQDITYQMPQDVQNDTEFLQTVSNMAVKFGADPSIFLRAMQFETGGSFDPAQKNSAGSGATGLIQFMPDTAKELGTTTEKLAKMTRTEQMYFVEKYFDKKLSGVKNPTFSDVYMAILWPAAVGKPDDHVIFKKGTKAYEMNSGLDTDGSGTVTKGEAAAKAFGRTSGSVIAMPAPGQVMNSERPMSRPKASEIEGIELTKGGNTSGGVSEAQSAPVEGSTEVRSTEGAEGATRSPEATQRVWEKLENQTKMMLVRLFGDEEAALKAISDGEISEEDLK